MAQVLNELERYRYLVKEIPDLEHIRNNAQTIKTKMKYHGHLSKFYAEKGCLDVRVKGLLSEIPFTREERATATGYYIMGKTWIDAAYDAVDKLLPEEKEKLFGSDGIIYDWYVERLKKSILRKIKRCDEKISGIVPKQGDQGISVKVSRSVRGRNNSRRNRNTRRQRINNRRSRSAQRQKNKSQRR